jgi:hypothetical protein
VRSPNVTCRTSLGSSFSAQPEPLPGARRASCRGEPVPTVEECTTAHLISRALDARTGRNRSDASTYTCVYSRVVRREALLPRWVSRRSRSYTGILSAHETSEPERMREPRPRHPRIRRTARAAEIGPRGIRVYGVSYTDVYGEIAEGRRLRRRAARSRCDILSLHFWTAGGEDFFNFVDRARDARESRRAESIVYENHYSQR